MRLWVPAALALYACSDRPDPPTTPGDLPYPRIASYTLAASLEDPTLAMLERVPLAVVDAELGARNAQVLEGVVAANPRMELLAHLTAVELPRVDNPGEQPLAVGRFAAIRATSWLTEPGSTLAMPISPTDTRIRVADPLAFSVTRPASPRYPADEPTYLLVDEEHVRLVAIEGDELVVERGVRSTPVMHANGARIAAHVVYRAGNWMLDVGSADWRGVLVDGVTSLITAGPWTGVAVDGCTANVGPIDSNRDGIADEPMAASAAWAIGFGTLADSLRAALGDDAPIVANAGTGDCAHEALDGIVLEGFPVGARPEDLAFQTGFDRYLRWTSRASRPPLSLANAFSPGIGLGTIDPDEEAVAQRDFAAMRFGLATALMGDGYYVFDNGPLGHDVAWWYDEYDGGGRGMGWLGHPHGPPTRVSGGAYLRTFTSGMAIANPTDTPLLVTVPPGYMRLTGMQDPDRNSGVVVEGQVSVPAHDGFLLTR